MRLLLLVLDRTQSKWRLPTVLLLSTIIDTRRTRTVVQSYTYSRTVLHVQSYSRTAVHAKLRGAVVRAISPNLAN